jgi:hypothetical protein
MTRKHSLLLSTAIRSESRGTPSPQAGSGPDITTVFYALATESSHTDGGYENVQFFPLSSHFRIPLEILSTVSASARFHQTFVHLRYKVHIAVTNTIFPSSIWRPLVYLNTNVYEEPAASIFQHQTLSRWNNQRH